MEEKYTCKECGKSKPYPVKAKFKRNTCLSCSANARRFVVIYNCTLYKGSSCLVCKYSKCIRALDFHHVNSNDKPYSISGAHCRSWKSIKSELDKCVLLCANCHREHHYGLISTKTLTGLERVRPEPDMTKVKKKVYRVKTKRQLRVPKVPKPPVKKRLFQK